MRWQVEAAAYVTDRGMATKPMKSRSRNQFILQQTIGYIIIGSAWILLSDQVTAGLTDVSHMAWLSTVKGLGFIAVTAIFLFFTLKAVPPASDPDREVPFTAVDAMASGTSGLSRPAAFLLAAALTLLTALAERELSVTLQDRPVFILFILPIVISAMIGGLGPGLLSTLLASALLSFSVRPLGVPLAGEPGDRARLVLLIVNGVAVSLMSEALRRSRARAKAGRRLLEAVASGTSDAIFVKDAEGRFLLCNDAAALPTGRAATDLIGKTAAEVFDEISASRIAASDRAVLETGNLHTEEITLHNTTGEPITFLSTTGPIFDGLGRTQALFGIARNITERIRAETALMESERAYRSLFENMLEGFALCRMKTTEPLDFIYMSVNPAFERLTGLKDPVGKWVSELIPGIRETNAELLETYRRVATGGDPERLETFVPGLAIWFSVAVYSPKPDHFIAIFDNITERKRAEERLETESGGLRNIITHLPDLVWLKDPDGIYLACNPEFERMFGASESEIIGKTDYDFVEKALADFFREKDRLAIEAGGPSKNEEWVVYASDGHRALLETIKTPLYAADGSLQGVLGVARDITRRHKEEERLLLQGAALESAANAIVITDPEGTIEWVNPAFTELTGYTAEEAIGRNPREILKSGLHGNSEYAALWQTIKAGQVWHGEFINRKKDGATYHEDQTITPVRDEHGVIRHFVSIKQDITEKFHAEQAALESELQISSIIDSLGSPLAMIDESGTILRTNRAWDQAYEDPKSTTIRAIGLNYVEEMRKRMQPDTAEDVSDKLQAVIQASIPSLSMEVPITSSSGQRWILLRAYRIRGRRMALVVVHDDITERKATEEALTQAHTKLQDHRDHLEELVAERTAELKEAEMRTRLIVDSSAAGLFGIDSNGNFTFVNPAACSMLGTTSEKLAGKPVHETIHHSRPDRTPFPACECPMIVSMNNGETVKNARDVFWRADGVSFPVAYASRPIAEGDAKGGAVVSFMDISVQIQAEAAREAALREAQRLAEARSDFLANMSHEIRTPLNAVIGFAQTGRRESTGRKSFQTFERILDAGQLLLGLINDILDVTKIEAGKLRIEEGVIRLGPVLEQAVSIVTERARNKGISVELFKSDDLPAHCKGDPLRVSQILLNLLSNAVKFTEQGKVVLSARIEHRRLLFEVSDTGIGMTAEQMERLFHPFEQADASTTRRFGGTGLGLSISQHLAGRMGGEIRVVSHVNAGSRFTLDLPFLEIETDGDPTEPTAAGEGLADAHPRGQARLAGISILSAEDNEINQMVLEEMVLSEGAQLVQVENGRLAVEQVARRGAQAFDIVLMDIQMPIMDGYEATRLLSATAPGLPVIGLTAHALTEERDRCLAAGMVDHLAKPIDLDRLVGMILHHTGRDASPPGTGTAGATGQSAPDPEAAGVPAPIFDMEALEERYSGKADFLKRLLETIVSSNAKVPEQLRSAATSRQFGQIAFLAHCAKGMSANILAKSVNQLARKTESAAREGRADCVEMAEELAKAVEDLLSVVEGHARDASAGTNEAAKGEENSHG